MAKINQVSPEKQELFKKLIKEYGLKTAVDLQNMLKEMFAPMLQNMLEAELDNSLGYDRYEHTEEIQPNSRNGHSQKTVTTSMGDVEIAIPRDRNGEFEPQVVKKYQRDVSDIEDMVISMYAKGMTTRDISGHLNDICGIQASAEMISKITDRIMPEAKAWQNRPLDSKYTVMFMDAIHYHVKEDNVIVKKAVYIAIGIKTDGTKEVLGMYVGGNESAKYWLGVLNDLKNRGVSDILIACVDGLTGFAEAIAAVFPTDESLFKLLFLAMQNITDKWTGKSYNWALIMNQLLIMYPDRLSTAGIE